MGDFNNWDPNVHLIKNDGKGIWTKSVMIPPGKYEYKFLIDGDWKESPLPLRGLERFAKRIFTVCLTGKYAFYPILT